MKLFRCWLLDALGMLYVLAGRLRRVTKSDDIRRYVLGGLAAGCASCMVLLGVMEPWAKFGASRYGSDVKIEASSADDEIWESLP